MPFTLSRVEMLDGLQEMDAGKLTHYDAHCPRCRRANKVDRKRMEMFFPNWREALKEFEAEMKAHPQSEAPLPAHAADSASQAESKPAAESIKEKPAAKEKSKVKPASKPKTPAKKKR